VEAVTIATATSGRTYWKRLADMQGSPVAALT
jgi:hypothetical protein